MRIFMRVCFNISCFAIIAGIVFLIIGFNMKIPIAINKQYNYDFSKDYENVKSIDLNIAYGSVIIKEGEGFHIEATNMIEEKFSSTIEDSVWTIQDNNELNNEISLFDVNISMNTWKLRVVKDLPQIVIIIPKGFEAEKLNITLGAGMMNADSLTAEEANIHVGAGECRIKELTVMKKSDYSVGAGDLNIDNMIVNDINMKCGIGNLEASGIITGDNYVSNGIGNINLNIKGIEENYNYSVDGGIGSVIINNNRYNGLNPKIKINKGAENSFTLDHGIGMITLKIND